MDLGCDKWTIREWIEKTNVDPRCPFFNEAISCPVRKQLFELGYKYGEKASNNSKE